MLLLLLLVMMQLVRRMRLMVELLLLGRHDRRAIRSVPRRLSLSLTGTDGDITDAALRSGRVRRDGRTGRRARRSGASESGDHVERLAQERRNVTKKKRREAVVEAQTKEEAESAARRHHGARADHQPHPRAERRDSLPSEPAPLPGS